VLPGEYVVKLSVDGQEMSKTVVVEEDPRIEIARADAEERLKTMLAINKLQKSGNDAQRTLDNLRSQLNSLHDNLKKASAPEPVMVAVNSVLQDVGEVRRDLSPTFGGTNQQEAAGPPDQAVISAIMVRVNRLFNELDTYTERPSVQQQERLQNYTSLLNAQIEKVNKLITESVPNLNRQIAESGMTPINAGQTIAPLQ
jgi:hypothetical protein